MFERTHSSHSLELWQSNTVQSFLFMSAGERVKRKTPIIGQSDRSMRPNRREIFVCMRERRGVNRCYGCLTLSLQRCAGVSRFRMTSGSSRSEKRQRSIVLEALRQCDLWPKNETTPEGRSKTQGVRLTGGDVPDAPVVVSINIVGAMYGGVNALRSARSIATALRAFSNSRAG